MWIRSQKRNMLADINLMFMCNESDGWVIYCESAGGVTDRLGVYSTEEKALKVLDRIEELIANQCGLTFYMPADDEVVTVKKRVDYSEFRMLEQKEK
jgi:hypothetical protein